MKVFILLFGLLSFVSACNALGEDISLQSGKTQVQLIELYTSEGCSSCPPAERYLNAFSHHENLWTHFVPLAFHVDYWDYLGWKDRFSSPGYSQRQRRYAQIRGQRTVYTPAFIVNGENWRPGFYNKSVSAGNTPAGLLSLHINAQGIRAEFDAAERRSKPAQLNIALLGMGIESRITAGENRGNRAEHEFVVLSHQQYTSENNQWQVALPGYPGSDVPAFAIAAWISAPDDPTPVQAVGGALPAAWIR